MEASTENNVAHNLQASDRKGHMYILDDFWPPDVITFTWATSLSSAFFRGASMTWTLSNQDQSEYEDIKKRRHPEGDPTKFY